MIKKLIFISIIILECKSDILDQVASYINQERWKVEDWQNSKLQELANNDSSDMELNKRFSKALERELTTTKKEELLNVFQNINKLQEKARNNNMSLAEKFELKRLKDYVHGSLLIKRS